MSHQLTLLPANCDRFLRKKAAPSKPPTSTAALANTTFVLFTHLLAMHRLDTLSGWDVMDTSAREFDYKDLDADSLGGGGGAFDHYVGKMAEAGMDFSDFTIYSAAEVSVQIQRKASYFVLK